MLTFHFSRTDLVIELIVSSGDEAFADPSTSLYFIPIWIWLPALLATITAIVLLAARFSRRDHD